MNINWEEFKLYKQEMPHLKGDNFDKLIYFIKSFYNLSNPVKIYNMLLSDETSQLMLEKRKIDSAIKLEEYIKNI